MHFTGNIFGYFFCLFGEKYMYQNEFYIRFKPYLIVFVLIGFYFNLIKLRGIFFCFFFFKFGENVLNLYMNESYHY